MVRAELRTPLVLVLLYCAVVLTHASPPHCPSLAAAPAALLQVRARISSLSANDPSPKTLDVGQNGTIESLNFEGLCQATLSTNWAKSATDAQLLELCTKDVAPTPCKEVFDGPLLQRPWKPATISVACERLNVAQAGGSAPLSKQRLALTMSSRASSRVGETGIDGTVLDTALASKVAIPENQSRVSGPPFASGAAFPPDLLGTPYPSANLSIANATNGTNITNLTSFDCEDGQYDDPSVINASILCTTTTTTTSGASTPPGNSTGTAVANSSEGANANVSGGADSNTSKVGSLNASSQTHANGTGVPNSNVTPSSVGSLNASIGTTDAGHIDGAKDTNDTVVEVGNSTSEVNTSSNHSQV